MPFRILFLFVALVLFVIAFIVSLPTSGVFLTLGAQSWAISGFIAIVLAALSGNRTVPGTTSA